MIYAIAFVIITNTFGVILIYFIIFGDIMGSLVSQIIGLDGFFEERTLYVLLLAAGLFPLIIKQELTELKFTSVVLFIGVFIFILTLSAQFIFEGSANNDDSFDRYWTIDMDTSSIKAFAIIAVAYAC